MCAITSSFSDSRDEASNGLIWLKDGSGEQGLPSLNLIWLYQCNEIHEIEEIRSGNQRVSDYWFFLGFSSWGWDQLFDEIAQGAWNLSEEHEKELLDWPWLY
ncbi:TRANSPORTER putative-RELATED [Salix purpurea]|uniref:TRANSPORTER putative-RELATED n=1 Tax=Salix purpurea TaxID=77065 RepID=A0A9Q0V1V8_SALPP|nr:TRANSPORTER putative-RELATED [Salix purpurea]